MSSNLIGQPYPIILNPHGGGGSAKPAANAEYHVGEIDKDPIQFPRTDLAYKDESGTERDITSPIYTNNSGAFVASKNSSTIIQPYMKDGVGYSVLIRGRRGDIYSNKHVGDPGNITEAVFGKNLIPNSDFSISGSVADAPDATPRSYAADDELFQGIKAVGALSEVTYIDGKLKGTGQLYVDVYKTEKQKLSTARHVASIASSDGVPYKSGASFVDNGDYWRVTFDMSDTFSVKLEQGRAATGHASFPESRNINLSSIPGIKPLGRNQIMSTDPLDLSLDSTAAFNSFQASVKRGEACTVDIDCMIAVTDTLVIDNANISYKCTRGGRDTGNACGFKWALGRDSNNKNKDFFRMSGWRFSNVEGIRIITPAVYDPSNPNYSEDHTLKSIFNLRWRQEEGDRINSTDRFGDLYVGWYDQDAWPTEFNSRFARGAKYLFLCENENGFNNNGNNDFHRIDNVVSYQIHTLASVQNAQNLGWDFNNVQFFWGSRVLESPRGGIHKFRNLWLGGLSNEDPDIGVFDFGRYGSSEEISEVYVDGLSTERMMAERFILAKGGSVRFKADNNGRCGMSPETPASNDIKILDIRNDCIRTDIEFGDLQLSRDSFSTGGEFSFRYDTNSRNHRLKFSGCRGDVIEESKLVAGSRNQWTLRFINENPSPIESFMGAQSVAFPSTDYTLSYRYQDNLKDGFGKIPFTKIYEVAYCQHVNGMAVGETGVSALTVVDSVTFRVKPKSSTSFVVDNVLTEDMKVIGVSCRSLYNDTSAQRYKVKSGDGSFTFGAGINNGSQDDRFAPLTDSDSNFYQSSSDSRLRFEGYGTDGTTPKAFTPSSDSHTLAVTIHYVSLKTDYIDIDKYNLLPIKNGV